MADLPDPRLDFERTEQHICTFKSQWFSRDYFEYEKDNFETLLASLTEKGGNAQFCDFDLMKYGETLQTKLSEFDIRFYFDGTKCLSQAIEFSMLPDLARCEIVVDNCELTPKELKSLCEWQIHKSQYRSLFLGFDKLEVRFTHGLIYLTDHGADPRKLEKVSKVLLSSTIWNRPKANIQFYFVPFSSNSSYIQRFLSSKTPKKLEMDVGLVPMATLQLYADSVHHLQQKIDNTDHKSTVFQSFDMGHKRLYVSHQINRRQKQNKLHCKVLTFFRFKSLNYVNIIFEGYDNMIQNLLFLLDARFLPNLKSIDINGVIKRTDENDAAISRSWPMSRILTKLLSKCDTLEKLSLNISGNEQFPIATFSTIYLMSNIKEWTINLPELHIVIEHSRKLLRMRKNDRNSSYITHNQQFIKTNGLRRRQLSHRGLARNYQGRR